MIDKVSTNVHMLTLGSSVPMLSMMFELHRELDETDDTFTLSTNTKHTARKLRSDSYEINTVFLGIHPSTMDRIPEEILDVISEKNLLVLCYEHYLGNIPNSVTDKVKVVPISTDGEFARQIEDALIAHQSSLATEQSSAAAAVPDGQKIAKAKQ